MKHLFTPGSTLATSDTLFSTSFEVCSNFVRSLFAHKRFTPMKFVPGFQKRNKLPKAYDRHRLSGTNKVFPVGKQSTSMEL